MKLDDLRRIGQEVDAMNRILYGEDLSRWPQNVVRASTLIDVLLGHVGTFQEAFEQKGHQAVFGDRGWLLQHPFECRPNMHECPLHDAIHAACEFGPPVEPGTYDVWLDENDELRFVPAGEAA